MLRRLFFGEREKSGWSLAPQVSTIEAYCEAIQPALNRDKTFAKYYRLQLMAQALIPALKELELSVYASHVLAEGLLAKKSTGQLDNGERLDYELHLYFYKNAIIRLFAILDKLGAFMNLQFDAKTELMKPKFSYFTVLRRLKQKRLHPDLLIRLEEIKGQYADTMQKLRNKRNMEIHYINVEYLDDLLLEEKKYLEHQNVEDLSSNLAELDRGFEMVSRSLQGVFHYCKERHD